MSKKKDSSAPPNSYLKFALAERPRILLEIPNISNNDVNKEIGSRWKNLSKEDKLKYKERSTPEPVHEQVKKKKKKKKDPLAPKLPLSSYMEFSKQERAKVMSDLGNISIGEVGKELGRRWQGLGKEDKDVFEKKARENRDNYVKVKNTYDEKKLAEKNILPLLSVNNSDEETLDPEPTHQAHGSPSQDNCSALETGGSAPQDGVAASHVDGSAPHFDGSALQDEGSTPQDMGSSSRDNESTHHTIQMVDLGFARQKQFAWHPALKIGYLANGTRVKIQFFGTGESAIVDKSKWLMYSDRAEERIKTPSLMKLAAFKKGLSQMKALRDKLKSCGDGFPVTASGIEFVPRVGGRSFRRLNKDQLQKEEEENLRQMEKKMRQEVGSKLWKCKDCGWSGKFRLRAKAHARDCGQRKAVNIRKSNKKQFECSKLNCELSFSLRSKLLDHYRSAHFEPSQVYNCVPCQKTFKAWRNFKRHGEEKHGQAGKYSCSECQFKTNRRETLSRHQKRRHFSLCVVSELLDGIIARVVQKEDGAEQEMLGDVSEGSSRQVVLSMLDGLLNDVVVEKTEEYIIVESAEDENLSECEQKRNRRVAQIRAEFDLLYPSFAQEVRDLRVIKSVRKRRKVFQTPVRKSNRIQKQGEVDESEVVMGATNGTEVEEDILLGDLQPGIDEDLEDGIGDGAIVNVEQAGEDGSTEAEMNSVRNGVSGAGDRDAIDVGVVVHGSGVSGDGESNAGEEYISTVSDCDLELAAMGAAAPPLGRFACIPCERDSGNLKRHVKLMHGVRVQPLKCTRPWCDKEFSILVQAISHSKACLKTCPSCAKTFDRLDKFEAHMRAHTTMNIRMMD